MDLDLLTTLRSTGAVREFRDEPVPDEVLARVLETARFAPSGGNRQGWRVIVIKDPAARTAVRDLYLSGWYEYLALSAAGLTPWSPVNDREAEAAALANAGQFAANGAAAAGFAETLDTAPALLLVLADLGVLATVDRDLPLHAGRRCLHLSLRLEPAARGARREPGRGDDDDGGAPRGRAARPLRHSRARGSRRGSSCWGTRWLRHAG